MVEVKGEQGYASAFGSLDKAPGQPIILPAGETFLRDRAVICASIARTPHSVDRGIP
jgi:hypothetical protein